MIDGSNSHGGDFACHAIVQAHESLSHSDIRNAIESGRHVERDGRVGWLLKRGTCQQSWARWASFCWTYASM